MVLFSGKGGVGKTTIAAAFAMACAARGQRTLLIELHVKDKMAALFGAHEVGSNIVEIEQNLYAVNITPSVAMEEYALMKLKLRMVYKAVFENRIVGSFLKVIPGLNDLVMLGKAHFHATEVDDHGRYVWDKVVIDAPATGHGIFFLQVPAVITSIIESGPMFGEAKAIEEFLQDPKLTAINLVTLPEEMPMNETLMLRDVVQNELHVPIGFIVANCVYPNIFSHTQKEWIERTKDVDSELESQGFLDAARFRTQRSKMQKPHLDKLSQKIHKPLIKIPYYFTERFDFQTLRKIANEMERQLEHPQETLSNASPKTS